MARRNEAPKADRAHAESSDILYSLETELHGIYDGAQSSLAGEIDPLIPALYLDDDGATEQQRLQYAEKDGKLNGIAIIFAAYVVAANNKAIDKVNDAVDKVFNLNYDYMAGYIEDLTGVKIPKGSAGPSVNPFTKRTFDEASNASHVSAEIIDELKRGIMRGEGIPELSRRVRAVSNRSRNSATLVARTEVTRHQNGARLEVFSYAEDAGLLLEKQWFATLGDGRTRDSHEDIHEETVGIHDVFSNGLMYPGDPEGEPEEVCNCRCTMIPIVRGYKQELAA